MTEQTANYAVLGAGAWGTALAIMLAKGGNTVNLVARTEEKASQIQKLGEHLALPSIPLPETLMVHSLERENLWQDCLPKNAPGILVLAMPAQETRQAVRGLQVHVGPSQHLIITAKGLERGTQQRLTDVVAEEVPGASAAVLSGPSFAHDVARGLPTAVTLAAADLTVADSLCAAMRGQTFRPYASDDLVGVQLGGALKNVLAIAAGVVEGRGLGESAKAALITRGFAELSRLAISQGARPETLAGLSGLGDLVLTCSTAGSRNFRFGLQLGQGKTIDSLLANNQPLAEGAKTAAAALQLATRLEIDMPITQTVASVVEGDMSVDNAIEALMARPLKRE